MYCHAFSKGAGGLILCHALGSLYRISRVLTGIWGDCLSEKKTTLPETNSSPLKIVIERQAFFWEGLFQGICYFFGEYFLGSPNLLVRSCFLVDSKTRILAIHWPNWHPTSMYIWIYYITYSLKLNSSHLKMDGWETILPFWKLGLFSGIFAVSFREGRSTVNLVQIGMAQRDNVGVHGSFD